MVLIEQRQSLFARWLVSYLSMLIIPLVICLVIYHQSVQIVENELQKAHMASLKQTQQILDNKLLELTHISQSLAMNAQLRSLVYSQNLTNSTQQYTTVEVMNTLKSRQLANSLISQMGVYFTSAGYVLTGTGKISPASYYTHYLQNTWPTFDDWQNYINARHVQEYLPAISTSLNGQQQKTVIITQSLPMERVAGYQANLFIILDGQVIQETIDSLVWATPGQTLVIDSQDNLIFKSSGDDIGKLDLSYQQFEKDDPVTTLDNMMILKYDSEITQWKYLFAIPASVYMEKVAYIRRLTLICIILSAFTGIFLAFLFSKIYYRPISRILQLLVERVHLDSSKKNEYKTIEDSISYVLSVNEKQTRFLNEQNAIIRSDLFKNIMTGKMNNPFYIADIMRSYNLDFPETLFCVLLVEKNNESDLTNEKSQIWQNLLVICRKKQIEITWSEPEHSSSVLLCSTLKRPSFQTALHQIGNELCHEAGDFQNQSLILSFSDIKDNLPDVVDACREAGQIAQYRQLAGQSQCLYYEDLEQVEKLDIYHQYTFGLQQQLMNLIKAHDITKARQLLSKILLELNDKLLPAETVHYLMFSIVNTIVNMTGEMMLFVDQSLLIGKNPINRLLTCANLSDLEKTASDFLRQVEQALEQQQKESKPNRIEQIQNYIKHQYTDINLNIPQIAEAVDMTPSALSRLFKTQTGIVLLDYISKVRIEAAKNMLHDKTMNIKDIAIAVGYFNCNALIRVFKKIEGITPGKYRESIKD